MGEQVWLIVIFTSIVASVRPQQVLPCEVIHMEAFCNNKNLRSMPDMLPTGIQKLDLSQNLLQNLTQHHVLPAMSSLQHLNLHANQIHFIQPGIFKSFSSLRVLDLSHNHLDAFAALKTDVGRLSSVQSLDLSGNALYTGMSNFLLRDAPVLVNLSLDGNSITKVDKSTFAGASALRKIKLHNNVILEIEEGAFESLMDLAELDLSMNSITCITDFNLSQLQRLNLSKNSLELFQAVNIDAEYELLYLDLKENKMAYFPSLPKMSRLIYLDLSRNSLRSVNTSRLEDMDAMMEAPMAPHSSFTENFSPPSLSQLIYLDMGFNQITSVPSSFFTHMESLEVLNFSSNCLDTFSASYEVPLNALKTLDLSYNAIQNFSIGRHTLLSLEVLLLQGNYLATLDTSTFVRLPQIRELHLQDNYLAICEGHVEVFHNPPHLSCVSFSSISSLRHLSLSGNSLKSVPQNAFHGSPLHTLDLSGNPGLYINEQAFDGLEKSLTSLILKENYLKTLNADLSLLDKLRYADLSVNRLTTLPLLTQDSSIESLNLQNNSLVTLDHVAVLSLQKKLKVLYLSWNPLSCCSNPHLLTMVQGSSVEIPDLVGVTCRYTLNSKSLEVNINEVQPENCEEELANKNIHILVIVTTSAGCLVVLLVAVKLCHRRRQRLHNSFKA